MLNLIKNIALHNLYSIKKLKQSSKTYSIILLSTNFTQLNDLLDHDTFNE